MTSTLTPASRNKKTDGLLLTGLAAAAVAAVAAAIAGCGSGGSTQQAAGATQQAGGAITVSSRQVGGVGTVLTNQSGRTLYTPEQEANGSIKCTGSCLGFWFPVTMAQGATPRAASGVIGKLGSIKRPDNGDVQLTYNGDPLYTFRLDSAPGQARGNDFTDSFSGQSFLWHVAIVSVTAPAGGQPSSPSGNGGYNY
jgi:predicted lipoprotein with Yx(FWY)xxD motif